MFIKPFYPGMYIQRQILDGCKIIRPLRKHYVSTNLAYLNGVGNWDRGG